MTKPTPPAAAPRPRRLISRALAASLAAALLLAPACSNDDSSAASSDSGSSTTSRPTTTTASTAGAGEQEADAIRTEIQELLRSYDAVLGDIGARPDVASDRDSPEYAELRALLTPDSPMVEPLINALVAAGARGERQLATGGQRFPIERRVEGRVRATSGSEFNVMVCGHMNYGVFNEQNQQIELAEAHVEASDATVVRVGDELRIQSFDTLEANRCQEVEG